MYNREDIKDKPGAMMKKLFMLIFAVFTTASLALPVWAAPNFIAGDNEQAVTINSPLSDDTYIGANSAVINSDIDGDLIIGANDVQLNSQIEGDLLAGANSIVINGRVVGDARIGAGEVIINSTVDDDVIVGTANLTIGEKGVIKGDLIAGSAHVVVNGKIMGNAKIAGGEVTLNSVIDGNVEIKTDNVVYLMPGTKIGGELSYWAPKENPDFIKYAKKVVYHSKAKRSSVPALDAFMWMIPAVGIGFLLWKLICILLLGAVIIWLMPKLLPRVVGLIKYNYWTAFWQGLVFAIGVPVLMFVLAMTLIGMPLSILLGLIYGLIMMFGYASAVTLIGSWLIKKSDKIWSRQLIAFVVGSIIYGIIAIIPVLGCLVAFVLMMMGIGGFWQDRYKMFKAGKY
ncbi:MAG: polymer-forming cytoskeletal protein [Patescibacteria group bacterium]|jgi:cytoskeletal protein CcmA (bactofilin family)